MAKAIKFGFDERELGTASVVQGKIRLGYKDRADAEYMTGVLETYHAQMTDQMGYEAESLKPEELLSHVASRMRGRAWAEEMAGDDTADTGAGDEVANAEDDPDVTFEVANVFCPTGEGGGIDPTCSPKADPVHDKVIAFLHDYRENHNNRGANADSIAEHLGLSYKDTLKVLREMKEQKKIAAKKWGWGRRGNVKYSV